MDFIAIDVETANSDLASICQIGLASFLNGEVANTWGSLLDPEDEFDPINVAIHGIDEAKIAGAPKFPDLSSTLSQRLIETVVVSHTTFDRSAIGAVFSKYDLDLPEIRWLDSARVVRRTWPDLSQRGYGLANVAKRLGIQFRHHDAIEDARAAGEILVRAIGESGLSITDWLEGVIPTSRVPSGSPYRIASDGNPEGPLFGEVAVFTGALSIPRNQAAVLAADAGCEVAPSVTKATTLLVVGDQDVPQLAGHEKSSKHRKAEQLISKGQAVRILRETDFHSLVRLSD